MELPTKRINGHKGYVELTNEQMSCIASAYRTTRIWSVSIVEDLQRLCSCGSYEEYRTDRDGFSSMLNVHGYSMVKKALMIQNY